jgi:hypothetical protein
MIPIIIFIFLILIISCFALGFLYNEVFLYAACVLCIIFGLFLFVDGIETVQSTTRLTTPSVVKNVTIQTELETVRYQKFDSTITNGIALIFVLIGIGFIYFERKGRNDTKTQEGQSGKWL